ncbi:MAG: ribbon-helix-helix protein, CopG family [Actinomycetota bacterium]|nr:ribbon-helix-helix protein, CopG family [Actinomycetota bacterium]
MLGRTTKTITISLPPKVAKEVDRLAKAEKKTKSQLFRDMIAVYEEYVAEREWQELRRFGDKTAKKLGIASEEDVYRIINEVKGA